MILVGDFFAIVVVKQLFGGIGKNFVTPALAGRAALVASYAGTMSGAWADPQAGWVPLAGTADVVTAATPLAAYARYWVIVPIPGPISTTKSSDPTPAA